MAARQPMIEGNARGIEHVNAGEIPWLPSPAAARVHVKALGSAGSGSIELVRYAAGASLAIPAGGGPAFLYVLDGELIRRGRRLWPGTAEAIPADAGVGESHTDVGCTYLLVRWVEA